jgi:hypothetical protein
MTAHLDVVDRHPKQFRGDTILDLEARADHAIQSAINTLLEISERAMRESDIYFVCGQEDVAAEYKAKSEGLKQLAERLAKRS